MTTTTNNNNHNNHSAGISAALKQEITDLYISCPTLPVNYQIVNKIGEGTFSSVYKAIDLHYTPPPSQPQAQRPPSAAENTYSANHILKSSKFYQQYLSLKTQKNDKKMTRIVKLKKTATKDPFHYVALKRIYVTSSPTRILSELKMLLEMDHPNVVPLLSALRYQDQVIAVLPFFDHVDFRSYFTTMEPITRCSYLRQLASAVDYIHSKGILHRDIKPSNFLFDPKTSKGVLVDFGLAQFQDSPSLSASSQTNNKKKITLKPQSKPGVYTKDPRPGLRANRAGTRGFRAPEVLFKVIKQTTAIDIWSVGVIILCLFTKRFPFFCSNDDGEAMIEIAHIYGLKAMTNLASSFGKSFETNISTVDQPKSFLSIVRQLAPELETVVSPKGLELLEKGLTLDPAKRAKAKDLLNIVNNWEQDLLKSVDGHEDQENEGNESMKLKTNNEESGKQKEQTPRKKRKTYAKAK